MTEFSRHSSVRQVLVQMGDRGSELLLAHGLDTGQGFTDILSQYQTLEVAHRAGRLRDLDGLITALNLDREPAR